MIYDGAMRPRLLFWMLVSLALVLAPVSVSAQEDEDDELQDEEEEGDEELGEEEEDGEEGGQRDHDSLRIDVHFMIGYYAEVGGGLRLDIPIVSGGLIDGPDDDLTITVGAEVMYIYWSAFEGIGVYPVLAFQWNFYLTEAWSIFPEVGATLIISSNREEWYDPFIAPHAMFGVRWHFSENNTIFVRAGWPAGVHLGVTFLL